MTGPGDVTAGDIDLPSGVEILNPEAHIATLEKKTKLEMYLTIGHGRGYSPAEDNKTPDQPIGVIPIDSIFSPVKRVAYSVDAARVGQKTDYDKLTLDIETDGSLDPQAALREAAEILIKYLAIFTDADRVEALRDQGAALVAGRRRHRRRRRGSAGRRRDGRHPDRGARAGRPLLQLPQARRHPDGRRPRAEVASPSWPRSRTSAASRSRRSRRPSTRAVSGCALAKVSRRHAPSQAEREAVA